MGFFDDLDKEVRIPEATDRTVAPVGDYAGVIEKLKGGWVHRLKRIKPGQDRSKALEYQEVEVRYDEGKQKFLWSARLAEQRGRSFSNTLNNETRVLDETGLMDAFVDSPWVGKAALDACGVDLSTPDF